MSIEFFVPGIPKPQPRPRAFARKFGDKIIASVYDAHTAEGWKSQVALAAKPFIPKIPYEGPTFITLTFCFPRPKKHFTSKGLRPDAPYWHTARPDTDNLSKAVKDALVQIRLIKDDSQICTDLIKKRYDDIPGCSVELTFENLKM